MSLLFIEFLSCYIKFLKWHIVEYFVNKNGNLTVITKSTVVSLIWLQLRRWRPESDKVPFLLGVLWLFHVQPNLQRLKLKATKATFFAIMNLLLDLVQNRAT